MLPKNIIGLLTRGDAGIVSCVHASEARSSMVGSVRLVRWLKPPMRSTSQSSHSIGASSLPPAVVRKPHGALSHAGFSSIYRQQVGMWTLADEAIVDL